MKHDKTGLGSRLRYVRERWHLSQTDLSDRSGVNVTTIRQTEAGQIEADRFTVWKLAEALRIYPDWLMGRDDDFPMVPLWEMTVEAQHQSQNGPEQAGLPGYCVIDPGGPWYRDVDGEWAVNWEAVR